MAGPAHRARYTRRFSSADRRRIVERALSEELDEIDGDRSWATLHAEGPSLHVEIEAEDSVALRAATNTWLSLLDVGEQVAVRGAAALRTGESTSADGSDGGR